MSSFISSSANRFYAALEQAYGQASTVTNAQRVIGTRLQVKQVVAPSARRDKTGSRTAMLAATTNQRRTAFSLQTQVTSLNGGLPSCAPLLEAALGAPSMQSVGLIVAQQSAASLQMVAPHHLIAGSGVSFGKEVRFVTSVQDAHTVELNAPFSEAIPVDHAFTSCVTYRPGLATRSVTIYDYWDPAGALDRIVVGGAVDQMEVSVTSAAPEVVFSGHARDILDSLTFETGMGGLPLYPAEPPLAALTYSTVGAHVGQVWISTGSDAMSLTEAKVILQNNNRVRNFEVGSSYAAGVSPGGREVWAEFSLLADTEAQNAMLYRIAKQRGTVSAVLQIGTSIGQMMAVYLPSVTPELPIFDDTGARLAWHFGKSKATGVADDEISIAFA